VLSDEQKRRQYDQGFDLNDINSGGGGGTEFRTSGGANVDPNEIFRMFFGGGGGGGMSGMGGMPGMGGFDGDDLFSFMSGGGSQGGMP